MKPTRLILAGVLATLCAGFATAQQAPQSETIAFSHKIPVKWSYVLPKEVWTPVSNGINIVHAGGNIFAAEVQGSALAVDTNGDGKVDDKAKGISAELALKSKSTDGKPLHYGLRLTKTGEAWSYAAGGAMVGKAHGETISVIDQNNNGNYNDYGVDAMLVGNGDAAAFLSRVVNLDGELFNFEITADGTSATLSAWTGETGLLDVRNGFEGKGDIKAVVVSNERGDMSFNAAAAKKSLKVPAGNWVITSGLVTNGTESVRLAQGNMAVIAVGKDECTEMAWGGPINIDFQYTITGDKLTVPYNLKYYGRSGEEYRNFLPDATSPQIVVLDRKKRILLSTSRFPGC
ncbi:MAG: hypothetical protein EXS14_07265 [Planctomycetes bacterium]|nr:hypothetical protein [Planctomycetota bacterium]